MIYRITNFKIVSQIPCELAQQLDIDALEKVLYQKWKSHIENPNQITLDATCYESELGFPTKQKLLWEAVNWIYKQLGKTCKTLGLKMIGSKYLKWCSRYHSLSKMRRKTNKKRIALTGGLLKLLEKLIAFEHQLLNNNDITFTANYYKGVATIREIYTQQDTHFKTGAKIKNRIVSIVKNYIRPIVRGKETKSVEFGPKINKLIITDFKGKGKLPKNYQDQKKLKYAITKEPASRLEGSFGKEKEHYHLKKIKAKTKATETLWIFFGIHTANALEIGRRMTSKKLKEVA